MGHDIVNNLVTSPKSDNRTRLNGDQLKVEIERLQRKLGIVGIAYFVREGAPDVYNKLNETSVTFCQEYFISLKIKEKRVLKKYSKLHLKSFLKLKTLFTIIRNNGDLKRSCRKKNSKPKKNSANK